VVGALVVVATVVLGIHQLTAGSASGSAATDMTGNELQHYVSAPFWRNYHCRRPAQPVPPSLPTSNGEASATDVGLIDSAVCTYPPKKIRVQLALYATDAQSKAGWLRLEVPYHLGTDNGLPCNRHHLVGASGQWHHSAEGQIGGWRFCSIQHDGEGVIVWTLLSSATNSLPHSILAVAQQGKGEVDYHLTEWWRGCKHHLGEGMMGVPGSMPKCEGTM